MKIGKDRKAISPIIATVLLIAITLIAFAAIAGYMFGIFGSSAATANVQATVLSAKSGKGAGTAAVVTCQATSLNSSYINIQLKNTGVGSTSVTSVTVNTGGTTTTQQPTSPCPIGPAGSSNDTRIVVFEPGNGTFTAGQPFSGYVTLANGANLVFQGTFG